MRSGAISRERFSLEHHDFINPLTPPFSTGHASHRHPDAAPYLLTGVDLLPTNPKVERDSGLEEEQSQRAAPKF
jgi:hypothetical protein